MAKAKAQNACGMLRARSPLLHFRVLLPIRLPPPAGVIRGAYEDVVQSYLTFSIKLLTFFWLNMCHKPIFWPKVAQKCKTCSRLPELQKNLL